MTSPLGVAVGSCLFKEVYLQNVLNDCPFDCMAVAGMGTWVRKPVNYTSWGL